MKRVQTDRHKLVSYCPLCESRFNPVESHTLAEKDDRQLLHVRCRRCANAMLVVVEAQNGSLSSVGLVTDLSYQDVQRFKESGTVTTNDVISVHEGMESGDIWAKMSALPRA